MLLGIWHNLRPFLSGRIHRYSQTYFKYLSAEDETWSYRWHVAEGISLSSLLWELSEETLQPVNMLSLQVGMKAVNMVGLLNRHMQGHLSGTAGAVGNHSSSHSRGFSSLSAFQAHDQASTCPAVLLTLLFLSGALLDQKKNA